MLEPLQCPSCFTRFGLSAGRVRVGIRRAQCFRCDTVFGIELAVARLLALAPEPVPELELEQDQLPDLDLESEPEPEPQVAPAAEPAAPAFDDEPPSLTLGDLDVGEDEIMEKTLINYPPPPPLPETEPEAGPDDPRYATGGANYASARDAVARLMGAAPTVTVPPKALASRSSMDVEATLDALDSTLGGSPAAEPAAAPSKFPDLTSTVKLTSQEIQAAMASAHPSPAAVVPPPAPRTEFVPRMTAPAAMPESLGGQDANLLKVQLEQETCSNVTLEQMAAWIDQGRVHEYHMVARQFSDHWIEASKVPALRPLFERRKRGQIPLTDDLPIPPAEILPPKKSLFGGLFGRN